MSIAVIKTGGKQYKVSEGDTIKIEKIAEPTDKEKTLEFDDILNGKKVKASFVSEVKMPKVTVYKFKSKKRYERTQGHRQTMVQIKVENIG